MIQLYYTFSRLYLYFMVVRTAAFFLSATLLLLSRVCATGLVHRVQLVKQPSAVENIRNMGVQLDEPIVSLSDYSHSQVFGHLSVGNPPQQLTMLFDTGSSDILVPTTKIGTHSCYNLEDSVSHYKLKDVPDRLSGQGLFARDEIHFEDSSINTMFTGVDDFTERIGLGFRFGEFDGVFGLGLSDVPQMLARTPSSAPLFFRDQQISLFSCHLPMDTGMVGELLIGDICDDCFEGEIVYASVASSSRRWQVELDSVVVSDQTSSSLIGGDTIFEINSGTSIVSGPSSQVRAFMVAIGAEKQILDGGKKKNGPFHYTVDCTDISTLPRLDFIIGGYIYSLSGSDYVVTTNSGEGLTSCVVGMVGQDYLDEDSRWVVGESFMRRYYTVFDVAQRRIGLATARGISTTTSSPDAVTTAPPPLLSTSINSIPAPAAFVEEFRAEDALGEMEVRELFTGYVRKFGKKYSLNDLVGRFDAFLANVEFVRTHNAAADAGTHSFTVGLNKFADWRPEDLQAMFHRQRMEKNRMAGVRRKSAPRRLNTPPSPSSSFDRKHVRLGSIPRNWDWRKQGVITGVKEQGECEVCWAFAGVAAVEALHTLQTGEKVDLSVQEVLDCAAGGRSTCTNGGYVVNAFSYVNVRGGMMTEEAYPYTATAPGTGTQGCKHDAALKVEIEGAGDYERVEPAGHEGMLQLEVMTYPTVTAVVDATSPEFLLHKQGIFDMSGCWAGGDLNHAVHVVGYGAEGVLFWQKEYWLIKNSWGEGWGEGGYMRLRRNAGNQCGIASEAFYLVS